MCAYMGNTVYAIRCVCLCILCSGGHTVFVSLFIQNKNREQSVAAENTLLKGGKAKKIKRKSSAK